MTLLKRLGGGIGLALLAASPSWAAGSPTDCPAAYTAYSSRTLLIDLLLDPRAQAVVQSHDLLAGLPPIFTRDTPPTFASIITPRQLLTHSAGPLHPPANGRQIADALDRQLAAIPITEAAAVRRCARYDRDPPKLAAPTMHPAILVFEKSTGFRDEPAVQAAHRAFADMAARRNWSITFTEAAAVFNPQQLKDYDAVVWNNISGDALTVPQEDAFKAYLLAGGGFAGVHGSGGDPTYLWSWYPDTLIGARFLGHPADPQFRKATVVVEQPRSGITARLPDSWSMTEEWYSFEASPRRKGVHVLARLDEDSYQPVGELKMGDHPIAWSHCLGDGRAFYTAIGHRPESYVEPHSAELLEQGVAWAAGVGSSRCDKGREIARGP